MLHYSMAVDLCMFRKLLKYLSHFKLYSVDEDEEATIFNDVTVVADDNSSVTT